MFNNSKYTKIYYAITSRAQNRELEGYSEKHHIIPRCLGGNNKKDNIAKLTGREHYICHLLLTRMTEGDSRKKMTYAAWTMARTRKIKTNSRIYARLKEEATDQLRKLQKGVKRGPMSDSHKQKIKEATIKRYQDPEERKKTGDSQKGRTATDTTRAKMATSALKRIERDGPPTPSVHGMLGKTHSPETLDKMKAAWILRKSRKDPSSLLRYNAVSITELNALVNYWVIQPQCA